MKTAERFSKLLDSCRAIETAYTALLDPVKIGYTDERNRLVVFYNVPNLEVFTNYFKHVLDKANVPYTFVIMHPDQAQTDILIQAKFQP